MTDSFIRSALPRYGRTPRGLLRDPSMSHAAVRLYGLLDDYAGAEEHPWPKRDTLAAAMGCSLDTIDRAVKQLVDSGWLYVQRRWRPNGGGQTSNLYVLTAGPPAVENPVDGPVEGPVDSGSMSRTHAAPGAAPVRPHEEEPLEEEPPKPPKGGATARSTPPAGPAAPSPKQGNSDDPLPLAVADVGSNCDDGNMDTPVATRTRRKGVTDDDPMWSAFWAAYPRKTGKGAARTAWTRALAKVDSASVLIAAAESLAADKERDPQFTPHPATWLNQERWLDQQEAKKPDGLGGRWAPVKAGSPEECTKHKGERAASCRMCAADRLAGDVD